MFVEINVAHLLCYFIAVSFFTDPFMDNSKPGFLWITPMFDIIISFCYQCFSGEISFTRTIIPQNP